METRTLASADISGFLAAGTRSLLTQTLVFDTEELSSYLRAGRNVHVSGKRHLALTVARVEVFPAYQRQGFCRQFFSMLEAAGRLHGYEVLYVESVLNLNLRDWLLREGYQAWHPDETCVLRFLGK